MTYDRLLRRVVDFYFEDYVGHEGDFRPTFLLNDILWDNLKLGFSRVSTCCSMIASPAARQVPMSPDDVLALARRRPLERLRALGGSNEFNRLLDRFFSDYAWFLERTASRDDATIWLSDREGRREARGRAADVGTTIYEIVRSSAIRPAALPDHLIIWVSNAPKPVLRHVT